MTTKQAKDFLRGEGYFVDNLWHVSDVQDKFECDDEKAQDILYWSLANEITIEQLNETIYANAENNNLKKK